MNTDRYREVERMLWASIGLDPIERVVTLDRIGTNDINAVDKLPSAGDVLRQRRRKGQSL